MSEEKREGKKRAGGEELEGHKTGEEFSIEQQVAKEMFEKFPSLFMCVCVCGFSFKLFFMFHSSSFFVRRSCWVTQRERERRERERERLDGKMYWWVFFFSLCRWFVNTKLSEGERDGDFKNLHNFYCKKFLASLFFLFFYGDFLGFVFAVIALVGKLEAVSLDLKILQGEIMESVCWDFQALKSDFGVFIAIFCCISSF